jgi:hypothetical protein
VEVLIEWWFTLDFSKPTPELAMVNKEPQIGRKAPRVFSPCRPLRDVLQEHARKHLGKAGKRNPDILVNALYHPHPHAIAVPSQGN